MGCDRRGGAAFQLRAVVVLARADDLVVFALPDLEASLVDAVFFAEGGFVGVRRALAAIATLPDRQIARTKLRNLLNFKLSFYNGASVAVPREPWPVHGV